MKREELKKLGIEEDGLLDGVMTLYGKGIEKHKADLEAARSELEGVKAQLTEASETIAGFKELDVEAIKSSADEWKEKFETAKADADKRLAELQFNHALDGALLTARAKNPKAVRALLNADILQLQDDGTIAGLKEQLETLKNESDYLFDSDEPEPQIVTGGKNKNVLGDASAMAARRAAGLPVDNE